MRIRQIIAGAFALGLFLGSGEIYANGVRTSRGNYIKIETVKTLRTLESAAEILYGFPVVKYVRNEGDGSKKAWYAVRGKTLNLFKTRGLLTAIGDMAELADERYGNRNGETSYNEAWDLFQDLGKHNWTILKVVNP